MNRRQRLQAAIRKKFEEELGISLIMSAAMMIVLLGMAAFSVDMGWLYLETTRAHKAAESAALAGVVHMPLPTSVPFAGSEAETTAIEMASRSGYTNGGGTTVTPSPIAKKPNELNVQIDTSTRTFFMRLFGIRAVSFSRDATAQQLPPLKLGSDEPYLGTDPGVANRYFWAAINGECRKKEDGDPLSVRNQLDDCAGGVNIQHRDPAYYYAIEVPSSNVGDMLQVMIYDGPTNPGGIPGDLGNPGGGSDDDDDDDDGGGPVETTTFELLAPDQTPADPFDNSTVICSRSFSDPDDGDDAWTALPCSPTAVKGIYVLRVSISGMQSGINNFSIKTSTTGANNTAVYGLTAMSLWMQDAGVAAGFKMVKLEEYYAGNELVLGLFDAGDVSGGKANIAFKGEMASHDCQVRVLAEDNQTVLTSWSGDDSPGAAPCELDTSDKRFNNQWLEFRFDIPNDYTCSSGPNACWIIADYDFASGAKVNERTTWTARINGQPIHLLP